MYFTLSPPRRSKQTMTGQMNDRMNVKHHFIHLSCHCKALDVCHLFLLLSSPCRVCIPLFLRLVRVNRPWQDGWMIRQMDDKTDEWNDASRRPLLYVMFFHTLLRVHTHTHIYMYIFTSVFFFFFFFFFPILSIFSIFWSFFSRIHTIEKKIPNFFQKNL